MIFANVYSHKSGEYVNMRYEMRVKTKHGVKSQKMTTWLIIHSQIEKFSSHFVIHYVTDSGKPNLPS